MTSSILKVTNWFPYLEWKLIINFPGFVQQIFTFPVGFSFFLAFGSLVFFFCRFIGLSSLWDLKREVEKFVLISNTRGVWKKNQFRTNNEQRKNLSTNKSDPTAANLSLMMVGLKSFLLLCLLSCLNLSWSLRYQQRWFSLSQIKTGKNSPVFISLDAAVARLWKTQARSHHLQGSSLKQQCTPFSFSPRLLILFDLVWLAMDQL